MSVIAAAEGAGAVAAVSTSSLPSFKVWARKVSTSIPASSGYTLANQHRLAPHRNEHSESAAAGP
ncbi:hypothetical protein [Azospirillum canadense]|uniref:hypothetical protein n=1 Tax=Azospirillum canadense TaxID=403962 RepID=UPI002227242B|nr:hypothetical protein [Azospirillum canadense]MCW2242549.1 hypothetical protein [Azospirillum canadense]